MVYILTLLLKNNYKTFCFFYYFKNISNLITSVEVNEVQLFQYILKNIKYKLRSMCCFEYLLIYYLKKLQ